jgi:hypothetical protein
MSALFVSSYLRRLPTLRVTNPPYNINQPEQLIKEMRFSRRLKFLFWSSGLLSCVVMYVVTLVVKEPTPYPADLGFVQCYEVEMVRQISKESTLSPACYSAVYCRKWLTKIGRNLLPLQQI